MDIKQQAIEHYERMIAWAEKQKDKNETNYHEMVNDIGEYWQAGYCSYCGFYLKQYSTAYASCTTCPLKTFVGCCDGKWTRMNYSKTWKEWSAAAQKVLDYIKKNG